MAGGKNFLEAEDCFTLLSLVYTLTKLARNFKGFLSLLVSALCEQTNLHQIDFRYKLTERYELDR